MKRKNDEEMVQTAVRLPQSIRDRLSKAGGERGLGEEIRARLEASFEAENVPADPKTRELIDAISFFTKETARDYGDWSTDPFAFEVVKACVDMLLKHHHPEGEPVAKPTPEGLSDLLYAPDHSIEAISRLTVGGWMRDQAKRKSGDEEKRR